MWEGPGQGSAERVLGVREPGRHGRTGKERIATARVTTSRSCCGFSREAEVVREPGIAPEERQARSVGAAGGRLARAVPPSTPLGPGLLCASSRAPQEVGGAFLGTEGLHLEPMATSEANPSSPGGQCPGWGSSDALPVPPRVCLPMKGPSCGQLTPCGTDPSFFPS